MFLILLLSPVPACLSAVSTSAFHLTCQVLFSFSKTLEMSLVGEL